MPRRNRVVFTRKDLKRLAVLAAGYLVTALWPRRWDQFIVTWYAALFCRLKQRKIERLASVMEHVLGPAATDLNLLEEARNWYQMRIEVGWGGIRELHKRGWNPYIRVEGLHHVQDGLAVGRGVILWGTLSCGFIIAKAGLWRAGVRLAHLSRQTHLAPSKSWLGLRVIGPVELRAETSYLERRVLIPLDDSLAYMRELLELLRSNACLSITGELQGRQNATAEFLGGLEEFATGAPGLAWKTRSVLLTYYVVRESRLRYRVVIDPPIEAGHSLERQEFVRVASEQFALRLQNHIVENPSSWDRWEIARFEQQIRMLRRDLTHLLPIRARFVLVDEGRFGSVFAAGLRSTPFLERNGQYWGRPSDDRTAIEELERLRQSGATFIVIAWPAFWWFGHYCEFSRYLRERFRCLLENERAVVFDLQP